MKDNLNNEKINNEDALLLAGLSAQVKRYKEIAAINEIVEQKVIQTNFKKSKSSFINISLIVVVLLIGSWFFINQFTKDAQKAKVNSQNSIEYHNLKGTDTHSNKIAQENKQTTEAENINIPNKKNAPQVFIEKVRSLDNSIHNIQLETNDLQNQKIPVVIITFKNTNLTLQQLRDILQNSLSANNFKISYGDIAGNLLKISTASRSGKTYNFKINGRTHSNTVLLEIELNMAIGITEANEESYEVFFKLIESVLKNYKEQI